jgi:hypothetical protein
VAELAAGRAGHQSVGTNRCSSEVQCCTTMT